MQQLSGLDSLFSYNESPSTPMHIGSLSVYALPKKAKGAAVPVFEDVQAIVEAGLDNSPIFRRKLVRLPGNFDRPYWVEQRQLDLSRHVRRASLRGNGKEKQLNELVADIHARPLQQDRPLWEIWFIDGLEQGPNHFALYMKVHHSVLDGISGAEVFASLHSIEPDFDSAAVREAARKARPWKNPFAWSLPDTTRAQWAHFANPNRRLEKMRNISQLNSVVREKRKELSGSDDKMLDLNWERSRFNNRISASRTVEIVDLPLERLRTLRRSVPGATINHVLLAIIGGALREYLLSKEDLPETALSTVVPMNVRQRGENATGNVLSILLANLHTDIEDAHERLLAVRDSATQGRQQSLDLGKNTVRLIADVLPSRTAAIGLKAISALSLLPGETRLPFNTVVSNLALPPVRLYFAGAELQQLSCFGLLANHIGLFHTAVTYQQTLSLTVLACKKIMPDADYYAECLHSSFKALSKSVR